LFANRGAEIAAVIVEPIAANMGFVLPKPGFLSGLRELTQTHGAIFILDEVMTGFRVAAGGAQALWGLDPDLTCLGKVIGGGLPVGAYAGKRQLMQLVAPAGPMYQAGILSGNPLAMTAGLTTLRTAFGGDAGAFQQAVTRTARLADGLRMLGERYRIPVQVGNVGTMFGCYFLRQEGSQITSYAEAKAYADSQRYARFFWAMADQGIYLAPSQFEAGFLSTAHSDADIDETLAAAEVAFAGLVSSAE